MGQALAAGSTDQVVRARLASGGDEMPSFAHLAPAEVDALIGYLVELGGGQPPPAPAVPALHGTALGEHLFLSNCAGCHGDERSVTTGISCRPADLAGATQRFNKTQVMNLLRVGTGPMPAFGHLNNVERDALWSYLDTLEAGPNAPTGASCGMVRAAMEGRAPAAGGGGGCGCGGAAAPPAAPSLAPPGVPAAAGGCGGGGAGAGCGAGCGGGAAAPSTGGGCGCGGGR